MSERSKDAIQRRTVEIVFSFERRLDLANRWFLILGIGATVTLVFTQVVLRRFFAHPLSWGEELARYLILWSMFLALGQGLATGRFIGTEMLVRKLPKTVREATVYLRYALVLIFAYIVLSEGVKLVALVERRNQLTPALGLRMSCFYSAIPLGAAVLIVKTLLLVYKKIARIDRPAEFEADLQTGCS